MGKTVKEFLRQKPVLFWTIAWPSIWVLIGSFAFVVNAPADLIPYARGSYTIQMMTFALTIAGMANLAGNITEDRERGLLSKLKSMPVSPLRDLMGRILGLLVFSSLAIVLVLLVGCACGAMFLLTMAGLWQSVGLLLVIFFASAGIGMLIGTFVKNVQGAVMTGVGISVITASLSGIFAPYSVLPSVLQCFSRIYPISSANSSIVYLLEGENLAGYNPLSVGQIALTLITSFSLFIAGLIAYSKICWRKR